jgi:hypothetical protein
LAIENQNHAAAPEMKPLCPEGQVPVAIQDPRYFHKGNPLIGPYAAPGPEQELPREFVKRNLLLTFDQVYGKSGGSSPPPDPSSTALPPAPGCAGSANFNACYFYASAAEVPTSLDGGGMILEIVAPLVDEDNAGGHSIGEIAVESSGVAGSSLDDVEMGFSVAPNQWFNNDPHLFVYHFIDAAGTCYNSCDWNQYSATYFPGMDLAPLVGQQVYIGWVQYQGAWWAWFNDQWLGYINNSAWTNNFTQTAIIQWYGEVAVVDGFPPRTQMGNAQFPAVTTAAGMSTLCAVNAGIWECDYADQQSTSAPQASYYDILNHSSFGAVRYGGPGETVGTVPTVTVLPSSASITVAQPLTVTVTVAGTGGNPTPTGPINLTSGSYTTLWTTTLVNGSATIAIPAGSLAVGNDTLTVNYAPDVASAWTYNYASGTAAISVTPVTASDFTLTIGGSGSSQMVQPGGTASYALSASPSGGTTFPAAVAFSASGVPAGFTATFSPSSLPAGSSATNVALMIQVPMTAMLRKSAQPGRGLPLIALGMLMLPFVAAIKRPCNRLRLTLIVMMVALSTLTGCGGGGSGSSGGGSSGGGGSQPQTYTITVTATSGTLSHSTPVTLTVE